MNKSTQAVAIGYGVVSYLTFLAAFLYAIGFVGGIGVPRSVDHALVAPLGQATVVDSLLLGLFAVQHSVMARPAFKRWWTRIVPRPVERSTYVLIASLVLFLLYWQWRSMPTQLWRVSFPPARLGLWVLFWVGWATVLATTFMISHFELFGLRQVFLAWREKPPTGLGFRAPLLYRVVRHPMMLGFIIAFWAAPTMTAGHLLFAVATTGYILIAVQLEERDLGVALGAEYRDYRRQVPILLPWPGATCRRAWRTCQPRLLVDMAGQPGLRDIADTVAALLQKAVDSLGGDKTAADGAPDGAAQRPRI